MNRKNIISAVLFLLLMAITFYVIFRNNDMGEILKYIGRLQPFYLVAAILTGLFFVSAEGMMICYLLRALRSSVSLWTCLKISFIGFFYCGITPSATGGQPMQLYHLKKSGQKIADSTVVLMTVALIYKLVLVLIGLGILVFWYPSLKLYLKEYLYLFYLGLLLNGGLVAVLLFVMISPRCFGRIVVRGEGLLLKLRILKPDQERRQKLFELSDRYHDAVVFFLQHKRHIALVTLFTFLQRFTVFFLTWLIYRGMGLTGHSMMAVVMIQATVYISVDMLPLPGSQGITELMYKTVFSAIFPGAALTASMCVTRGINFYFLLIISALISAVAALRLHTAPLTPESCSHGMRS
ncbi:MAG: flippase-like domain-containing protein [Lachnospiraceae bacterium]|nr:flippase-like domain-containing protein [Lachnospiraceae bacterium]MCI9149780.1 flippase-like domain-containing protein [Lachnospiraceae bacterium]